MNTMNSSNAMPESARDSHAQGSQTDESHVVAPAVFTVTRPLYWSIRRELWENRSIYIAPLAVGGVFLFGFLLSLIHLPATMRGLSALDPAQQHDSIAAPYDMAAGLMMLTTMLVSVFYCLDALHGERRDRSILFWKSLPVSDLTTALAKASIPLVIVPVLASLIGAALHLIMLLLSSAVLLGSGLSAAVLWTRLPWFQMSLLLLYHILTVHTLWPAPVYGWLFLVSAWARRATFLWAALPVVAIGAVELIAFRTSYFARMVGERLVGVSAARASTPDDLFPTNPMTHIAPDPFLMSPGLWIGLAVFAAFLAAAIRLRRYQGPI